MSENKKIIALLPLKAHSSRVKGKNFRLLAGKPLFAWILDTLLSIPEISQIVINTDAREMLIENGLEESERVLIRDRKSELCGDEVSMNLILEDDIKNTSADIYLMTHTTNPLLSASTIKSALNEFIGNNNKSANDSLFTVNRLQTRFYNEDCTPINHDPDNLIPTQNLEPWYEENSCLYLFTKESFISTNARIGQKPMLFETPRLESIDIDEEEDWLLAESLANSLLNR